MLLADLDTYVGLLDDAILTLAPSRVRQLEWLRYDLDTVCRGQIAAGRMSGINKRAWYRVVGDRLLAISLPTRISATMNRLTSLIRSASGGTSLRCAFGQMRIAGTFQALNIHQNAILGFPNDMAAASVADIANRLATGAYLPDQLPVRVFWHVPSNRWIVSNNRGYAAHCLANVRPLRLYPTTFLPTDIEITRLGEIEGQNGVPNFTGNRGGEPQPRILPSFRMFMTPVGNAITRVADVPAAWG